MRKRPSRKDLVTRLLQRSIYPTNDDLADMLMKPENDNNRNFSNDPEPTTMEIQSELCHSTDKVSEQSETLNSIIECGSVEVIDNPGPSTMTIQSEKYHDAEVAKQLDMQNSSMEYSSIETIDLSSDSDAYIPSIYESDDSFDYTRVDSSDIAIIDYSVKTVANDSVPSCSLHLANNKLLPNQVENIATNSDGQATAANNNIQEGPKEQITEENDNLSYRMNNSERKRLSKRSEPGCSKDSDADTSLKMEGFYNSANLDELKKDTKLMYALLPKLSRRLIFKTLYNNRSARNRNELTLWDLLPVQRPLPQPLKKRKYSDEICVIEYKKNPDTSLGENQVNTKGATKKKGKTCRRDEVVADNRKLQDEVFASSMGEFDGMKKNVSEQAASNSASNDTNQESARPKKTKIQEMDKPIEFVKDDNTIIFPNSYALVSPEIDSKAKEVRSSKNSEFEKKRELSPENNIFSILQPAKLTLQSNIMPALQKDERRTKPLTPILSPPKLIFVDRSAIPSTNSFSTQFPTTSTATVPNLISNVTETKPNEPIVFPSAPGPSSPMFYSVAKPLIVYSNNKMKHNRTLSDPSPSLPRSDGTLLNDASSNNKRASDLYVTQQNLIRQSLNVPRIKTNQLKVVKPEGTKLINVHSTRGQVVPLVRTSNLSTTAIPSSSVVTVQSTSNCQKASSSKANYNYEQERGNMSAPQIGDTLQQQLNLMKETSLKIREQLENMSNNATKIETPASTQKPKHIAKDANDGEIILNEEATKFYVKLIPMFPCVKTHYIKQLCHNYVRRDVLSSMNEEALLEYLVERLLNCDQMNILDEKTEPPLEATDANPVYDMNEQYADLLMIFPEADPVYLRKVAEEIYSNPEKIKEFVQSKLENPDYPTRAQYLAKKEITEQQKQYTTDFQVQQFLEIFPDPFLHFEDNKRKCEFNAHAVDFLKFYFCKLKVNTLLKAYTEYFYNLSLTAKALEVLNPDMKTKRHCNKTTLTEDIPFLQECAFIQHKAELRKYMDNVKIKEEQEFNELKARNELLECQCCYDNECMPSKCSTCEDGHIFCNLCIVRSTDIILGDGKTRVDCLLQCGCEFPISVLQRVLPPTKFSILLCKRQEAEVIAAGLEGLVSCPFCHFASIPPPEDKIFKCLNPNCMKESCRLCKELNHVPLKCTEKKSESARLYLEEKMTQALVRKCYRCNRIFFKEEGCNKMTCVCGAQMCYICDKPVTDYKHFQGQGAESSNLCPLWSDDRRLNAESVIKVCQETMKQIKEKDPKVDINVNALLPALPPKSKGPHENIPNAMIHNRIMRQFP